MHTKRRMDCPRELATLQRLHSQPPCERSMSDRPVGQLAWLQRAQIWQGRTAVASSNGRAICPDPNHPRCPIGKAPAGCSVPTGGASSENTLASSENFLSSASPSRPSNSARSANTSFSASSELFARIPSP
jgi:hypothetical protein